MIYMIISDQHNHKLISDLHDLHEHGVERASTIIQSRHSQQPDLPQTQVKKMPTLI